MKNAIGFILAAVALSAFSCQDSREEIGNADPVAEYSKVGMRIPTETGARWIDAYNERNNAGGRTDGVLYSIDSAPFTDMLSSVNNLIGVAFHYGIDELGTTHIIAVPVTNTLRLWTDIEGRKYIDANTSQVIASADAWTWATRYQEQNPNSIWFHYFGRNVFDEIVTLSNFESLDIFPAINDRDLSPQLLLIVGDGENISSGRTNTETNVYDASYPCPKCAVQ